jgi:uncharacterized protein (TIGR03437 family)
VFDAAWALTRFLFRARTFGALLILPLAHAQSVPRISTTGIVNTAGAPLPPAPVAPGSVVSIYGSNFNSSSGTHAGGVSAASTPLPTNIKGTQVLINSLFAPLYYVDSSQIDAQVPWEVGGASYLTVQIIVNGLPSNLATVALARNAPGLLLVTHALNGSLVTSSQPATPGEYLTIYGLGFGPVTNSPSDGAASSAAALSYTLQTPVLTIGGAVANVSFSGLAPGFTGLYQVNAQVPPEIPNGDDITIVLNIGGAMSNTITTSIQSGTPAKVQVSVSPVSVSLLAGATQQFTAAVSGSSNTSVNWTINGIPGGSSTVGTIFTTGLYTAPATASGTNIVFVAAASAANPTVAGTATAAVSAPLTPMSPLGRTRSNAPGIWTQFEERGGTSGYYAGQAIHMFTEFDPVVGGVVSQEISLQLDKMQAMGVTSITYALRTSKAQDLPGQPFVPPECPENLALGLNWPQPTSTELTNLVSFFDLVQSKGMKIRLGLINVHMEEQPPVNSTAWLGAILGAIGNHPALDVITFDGTPLLVPSTPSGPPDTCGIPAEAALWYGPGTVTTQYIQWAMGYARSLGVSAQKLSAEAITGNFETDSLQPNSCPNCATDGHFWNPITTLKDMFDDVGIPDSQRTYALSFYEHTKCSTVTNIPCADVAPHPWAEQAIQTTYGIIGTGNGARVVATEMGDFPPVSPAWKTEWAMESLASLMEKYQIEGGSFWIWVQNQDSDDSDPTLAEAVKLRGVNFDYNPVQKEILDWGGFHLTAIPNGSFEDDLDANRVPTHWAVTGNGSASAYYLPQESGQPQVPSRGSYCLRLTASDNSAAISATSEQIAVTPGTSYTTTANLRFSWTGDPNPSGNPTTRPQVFITIHYLNASGQPASVPSTIFSYFQEDSTQGFQTFVFQYTPPSDATSVQIEIGAARNGLSTPIVFDADNFR